MWSHAESAAYSGGAGTAAPDTLQRLLPPPVRDAEPLPPPAPQRPTTSLLPAAGADPGDLAALPGLNDAQRLMFSAFAVRINPTTAEGIPFEPFPRGRERLHRGCVLCSSGAWLPAGLCGAPLVAAN